MLCHFFWSVILLHEHDVCLALCVCVPVCVWKFLSDTYSAIVWERACQTDAVMCLIWGLVLSGNSDAHVREAGQCELLI